MFVSSIFFFLLFFLFYGLLVIGFVEILLLHGYWINSILIGTWCDSTFNYLIKFTFALYYYLCTSSTHIFLIVSDWEFLYSGLSLLFWYHPSHHEINEKVICANEWIFCKRKEPRIILLITNIISLSNLSLLFEDI